MARTISYQVTIQPNQTAASSVQPSEGSSQNVILSSTNLAAIQLLITKIQAGTDVSTVVTAINAL